MPYGLGLIDQPCKASNDRVLETKKHILQHYLDHLLFITETKNTDKVIFNKITDLKLNANVAESQ